MSATVTRPRGSKRYDNSDTWKRKGMLIFAPQVKASMSRDLILKIEMFMSSTEVKDSCLSGVHLL